MTDTKLAELTGKNYSYIWRERTKRDIKTADPLPKFDYNIDCFNKISNNETAYWLGYYFADGCVCKTGKRHIVSLSSCDKDVIEKLIKFYGMTLDKSPLYTKELESGKISYNLQLCNAKLFNSLVALGCCPRKSLILTKPNIDEAYYLAFLMGFLDGDGSISLNRSINSWKVAFGTGGEDFFGWLCKVINGLNLKYSIEIRNIKNGKFYIVVLCGINGKTILDHLYNSVPNNLPMIRKKAVYEIMKNVKFVLNKKTKFGFPSINS